MTRNEILVVSAKHPMAGCGSEPTWAIKPSITNTIGHDRVKVWYGMAERRRDITRDLARCFAFSIYLFRFRLANSTAAPTSTQIFKHFEGV